MAQETTLSYPALLIDGQFTPDERDHQINEAEKNKLPFFTLGIRNDIEFENDLSWMHLQGEMYTNETPFRDVAAMKEFMISKGFIDKSINFTKDAKLYSDHPEQSVSFIRYIVRMLMHFQITGEWLELDFNPEDYPIH